MPRAILSLAATALLTAGAAVAQAPPDLALRWLLNRCDTGEEGALRKEVRQYAAALEPVFIEAIEKGPPRKLVDRARRNAEKQFRENRELLRTGEGLGFDAASLELARRVTRKDFVSQAERDFAISYRSQGVAGLGITGGEPARQLLMKLVADQTSPLRSSARLALAALQTPPAQR